MQFLDNYLALEGVDGSGKSKALQYLYELLRRDIAKTRTYHDPDPAYPIGRQVYDLRNRGEALDDEARLALYAAASIEAQSQALATTKHDRYLIASDRSAFTTHFETETTSLSRFLAVHSGYRFPKLTFHLVIAKDLAMERAHIRDGGDHEREYLKLHYERMMARYGEAFAWARANNGIVQEVRITPERSPEDLAQEMLGVARRVFG
jgi:thymidylate kinase